MNQPTLLSPHQFYEKRSSLTRSEIYGSKIPGPIICYFAASTVVVVMALRCIALPEDECRIVQKIEQPPQREASAALPPPPSEDLPIPFIPNPQS